MTALDRHAHWQNVYTTKDEKEVSWFQESPTTSLDLIAAAGDETRSVIDIGGGASRLVDALLARGYRHVAVLDVSEAALMVARQRLGPAADAVRWIAADVTSWEPAEQYDIWHDRAAFHFLTAASDRDAYVTRLKQALRPGGQAIIGSFSLTGPERCSGLPVVRYDAQSLGVVLGPAFRLIETREEAHRTPWDATQHFQFSRFQRLDRAWTELNLD
ncbi:MAG TPA: class I SAM-dependent methyltransferase [Xanthobacteraceae bacterium]|nr:class I SAM-dependent methyltransferase [Xanthobacteraceae bacterium]